ncbi:MAG: phosphate uptake regulator PhoU [Candidatus Bathyarchaeia archaeon]
MEKDLGYRKIQCTGRGAYIISLPKGWVQNVGLKKGSEVAFKVRDDSSIILVPRKIMERQELEKPKLKEYCISAEPKEEIQSICRKIKSLYVIGADLIHVRFKGGEGASKYKMAINNLAKDILLGSEIVDETPNMVTLQILISHMEFPLEKAVRRMAVIALSANKDAIMALKSGDPELIQGVVNAYNDVNRLNLYVIRQLKFGIERNMFKELGFKTPKEFLAYRIVVNDIKSMAENAMNIVNNIVTIKKLIQDQMLFLKEPIDEELYSQVSNFNSLTHQLFEESLKAMFKKDYRHADEIISQAESLVTRENDLLMLMSSKKLDPNVSAIFRLILDSSRRIMDYSRDVAELTLNMTIGEISSMQTFKQP